MYGDLMHCNCPDFERGSACRAYFLLGTCTPGEGFKQEYDDGGGEVLKPAPIRSIKSTRVVEPIARMK